MGRVSANQKIAITLGITVLAMALLIISGISREDVIIEVIGTTLFIAALGSLLYTLIKSKKEPGNVTK